MLQQYGVLKTEESADRFFRGATEICVEACLKTIAPNPNPGSTPALALAPDDISGGATTTLTYTVVDALSKLFLLLIRVADKEANAAAAAGGGPNPNTVETSIAIRANILLKILSAVTRVLSEDHDSVCQQQQLHSRASFDQRPYHRLLLNLVNELGPSEPKVEQSVVFVPLLAVYTQAFLQISPNSAPGFAFSWLNAVSHANFMPHLLLSRDRKGWPLMHKLLRALLQFLHPFLKSLLLNDAIRRLYKETLRVLLVLLHDFPEFLCDYYVSLCDSIPTTCVQLRNLILSAFPSNMRLPDPFTPNLKVEGVPEISQTPRMVTDFVVGLHGINNGAFKARVDAFMQAPNVAANAELLSVAILLPALSLPPAPGAAAGAAHVCNIPITTSLVVYVGACGADQLKAAGGAKSAVRQTSAYSFLRYLITTAAPDAEFRYHLLNSMVNQLRYPNSHTYFHICMFQQLFQDMNEQAGAGDAELLVQEQIARVFLERLIVHRPHPVSQLSTLARFPFYFLLFSHLLSSLSIYVCLYVAFVASLSVQWGLLVTFIEFLKNPKFEFWQKPFTHCAAEIERVLQSVTKSCVSVPTGSGGTVPGAVSPVL